MRPLSWQRRTLFGISNGIHYRMQRNEADDGFTICIGNKCINILDHAFEGIKDDIL